MQNDPRHTQQGPAETPLTEPFVREQNASGGALSAEEIAAYGRRLFGKRHWRARMSEALGVQRSTVGRWASGKMSITPAAATAIRTLYANRKAQRAIQKALG